MEKTATTKTLPDNNNDYDDSAQKDDPPHRLLVLVALRVHRVKWIHQGRVVLEGTTTTTSRTTTTADNNNNNKDKTVFASVAAADKACLVTVSGPVRRKAKRKRQNGSNERNYNNDDNDKEYNNNNDSSIVATQTENADNNLTRLRRAADICNVQALGTALAVDNQPGNWIYVNTQNSSNNNKDDSEKEQHGIPSLCLTVACHPTTERNRRGTRRVECIQFLQLAWQMHNHPTPQSPNQPQRKDDRRLETTTRGGGKVQGPSARNNKNKHGNHQVAAVSSSSFGLHDKSRRQELFCDWIVQTYGVQTTAILDVAGGNGELARALIRRGVAPQVVLLDPKPRLYVGDCGDDAAKQQAEIDKHIILLARPLVGNGSDLLDCPTAGPLIRQCTLMVGMHPDQATEAMIDLAQSMQPNLPFALLPCCVMPSLFPTRRQTPGGDPVRSYRTFCTYLRHKAVPPYAETHLPFDGRNKVIYSLPKSSYLSSSDNKSSSSNSSRHNKDNMLGPNTCVMATVRPP